MTERSETTQHWISLARHTPLGIVCDLDGTLVPFASAPEEARPTEDVVALTTRLAELPGVTVAIVSGRPKDWLEQFFPLATTLLVAEHGAQRRGVGPWEQLGGFDAEPLAALAALLEQVARTHTGALVERKTTTVALHYRNVSPGRRGALLVEVYALVDAFCLAHPTFERLEGRFVVEVRPSVVHKGSAVPWVRAHAGEGARIIAFGDDVTDEHLFVALGGVGAGVVVRHGDPRPSPGR